MIEEFGHMMAFLSIITIVVMPLVVMFSKLCEKSKFINNLRNDLFYNSMIRMQTEMYIEMSFICFMNVKNFGFTNQSKIIATLVAFLVAVHVLFMPFIAASIVAAYFKKLHTVQFKKSLGNLTEGLDIN